MKRLLYDGLQPGQHTFTYDEVPDGDGGFRVVAQPDVLPGAVIEVEDLDDAKSERARICRGHVARGIARVIEPGAEPAAAAPPAKSPKKVAGRSETSKAA
jgi:hypothetical protein